MRTGKRQMMATEKLWKSEMNSVTIHDNGTGNGAKYLQKKNTHNVINRLQRMAKLKADRFFFVTGVRIYVCKYRNIYSESVNKRHFTEYAGIKGIFICFPFMLPLIVPFVSMLVSCYYRVLISFRIIPNVLNFGVLFFFFLLAREYCSVLETIEQLKKC